MGLLHTAIWTLQHRLYQPRRTARRRSSWRQALGNLCAPYRAGRSRHKRNPTAVKALLAKLSIGAALFIASGPSSKAEGNVLLPPPPGKLYFGVYPGGVNGEEDDITLKDVQAYETACGKRV